VATPHPEDLQLCDAALAEVFEILGKRWNGLLLAALAAGPVSFSRLRRGVPGISDSMLSERLTGLARAGLVVRTVDQGPPVAVTYELTDSAVALLPALQELADWARAHLSAPTAACP
jgi:DNA-binding HxlR family transcriptional regulator